MSNDNNRWVRAYSDLLDDHSPIDFKFKNGKIVPTEGEKLWNYTAEVYLHNVNEMAKEMFLLDNYSYATMLHTKELIIWNRKTRKIKITQKFNLINKLR